MKVQILFIVIFNISPVLGQDFDDFPGNSKKLYDWIQKDKEQYHSDEPFEKIESQVEKGIDKCKDIVSKITFEKNKHFGKSVCVQFPESKKDDGFNLKLQFDKIINDLDSNVCISENQLDFFPTNGQFQITINNKRVFYIDVLNPDKTQYFKHIEGNAFCISENVPEYTFLNLKDLHGSPMSFNKVNYRLVYQNKDFIFLTMNEMPENIRGYLFLEKDLNLYSISYKACSSKKEVLIDLLNTYFQPNGLKMDINNLDSEFYLMCIPTKLLYDRVVFKTFRKKRFEKIFFEKTFVESDK